jgi:predicted PurR-regulated permease PerM
MNEHVQAASTGNVAHPDPGNAATAGIGGLDRGRILARHLFAIPVFIGVALIVWTARSALGPFVLGLLLAYMMLPVVHLIERWLPAEGRLTPRQRPVAVLFTVAVMLVAMAVLISVLLEPVMDQTAELLKSLTTYWDHLLADYGTFGDWYEANVPDETQTWIEENIDEIGQSVIGGSRYLAGFFFNVAGNIVAGLAALVIGPLFAFYFLMDEKRIPEGLRRQLPEAWAEDAVAVYRLANGILGSYTRGVVVEAVIVGVITGAGYWLIGVDLFLPLGFIAFAGEIVPIAGPWIAFFISFPVVLATQPQLAIPAVVLFGMIQALEGWFLAPKIQGESVEFSASATLLILAIGGALGGALAVVLALPVAALIRALIVYTMRRLSGAAPGDAAIGLIPRMRQPATSEMGPQPGSG